MHSLCFRILVRKKQKLVQLDSVLFFSHYIECRGIMRFHWFSPHLRFWGYFYYKTLLNHLVCNIKQQILQKTNNIKRYMLSVFDNLYAYFKLQVWLIVYPCVSVCGFDYAYSTSVCLSAKQRFSYHVRSSFHHNPEDIYRSMYSTCSRTALHCDTHCCCRNYSLQDNLEKYGPSSLILNEPKDLLTF